MHPKATESALLDRQNAQGPPQGRSHERLKETELLAPRGATASKEHAVGEECSNSTGTDLVNHGLMILNKLQRQAKVLGLRNERKRRQTARQRCKRRG